MHGAIVILGSEPFPGGSPSPADRAALALAVRCFGRDVSAYARTSIAECLLRYALAAGARDVAILDHAIGAQELSRQAATCRAVICGTPITPLGDALPARLAEQMDCGLVFGVLELEPTIDGFHVARDLGRGATEVLEVRGRIVCGMAETTLHPGYVSRYRRWAIDEGRLTQALERAEHGPATVAESWHAVRPRPRFASEKKHEGLSAYQRMHDAFGIASPTKRNCPQQVVAADAATCAAHLLRYLLHYGFIARPLPLPMAPAMERPAQVAHSDAAAPALVAGRGARARGPRRLDGQASGIHRRPLSLVEAARANAAGSRKLLRGPRPVGMRHPVRLRGPFSLSAIGNEHHHAGL